MAPDRQAENVAAVTAWVEAYNTHDFDGLGALCDEAFRLEDPATSTHIAGRDAFVEIGRQVVGLYPDRRITITQLLPLGGGAVALKGDWDGTAASDTPTGARRGQAVHHDESMLVELVDGRLSYMRIYR